MKLLKRYLQHLCAYEPARKEDGYENDLKVQT
jgi:hypothetical protein